MTKGQQNSFDRDDYYSISAFEKYVNYILSKYNIRHIKSLKNKYNADFIADEGIPELNIRGKTLVEFKSRILYSTIQTAMDIFQTEKANPESDVNNYLLIYSKSLVEIPGFKSDNFYLFSIKEVTNKLGLHSSITIMKGEKEFDWEDEKKRKKNDAIVDYNKGNNTLVLGAGVSCSANVPDWKNLIDELFKNFYDELEQDQNSIINNIDSQLNKSNLIKTRYLESYMSSGNNTKKELIQLIRDIIYHDIKSSKLINSICKLMENKRVVEVITYNFDRLVEENINKRKIQIESVFDNSSSTFRKGTFPIYHVHGIIPPKNSPLSPMDIVFDEKSYHDRYTDAYGWSNVEQLHAFTRSRCFFIGLSLTDPNLRRLLDIASKNSEGDVIHYAFLYLNDYFESDRLSDEDFEVCMKTLERMFKEMRINVIWYNDYKELPKILNRIRYKELYDVKY